MTDFAVRFRVGAGFVNVTTADIGMGCIAPFTLLVQCAGIETHDRLGPGGLFTPQALGIKNTLLRLAAE